MTRNVVILGHALNPMTWHCSDIPKVLILNVAAQPCKLVQASHLELDDMRVPQLGMVEDLSLDIFVDRPALQKLLTGMRVVSDRDEWTSAEKLLSP